MTDVEKDMREAMVEQVRENLGSGYVDDYYEQIAEDFIQIALWYGDGVQN